MDLGLAIMLRRNGAPHYVPEFLDNHSSTKGGHAGRLLKRRQNSSKSCTVQAWSFDQGYKMLFSWIALCFLLRSISGASISISTSSTCSYESEPPYGCTDSMDWVGDGYKNEDCRAVIQRLFFVEVTKHGSSQFEFVLPGAENKTDKPIMRTPRRYVVG